jgi:hypothetical protein
MKKSGDKKWKMWHFALMPGAEQRKNLCCWLHWHPVQKLANIKIILRYFVLLGIMFPCFFTKKIYGIKKMFVCTHGLAKKTLKSSTSLDPILPSRVTTPAL